MTAFPLGLYVGNPTGAGGQGDAAFQQNFQAFEQLMGAKPTYMDTFIQFSLDPSQWASNAGYSATEWAQSGNAYVGPGSGVTPVIGVPMASTAGGWSNVDSFYKAIIAGKYDADYKGIVDAWAKQGYKTIQLRLGYEFDGTFMPWSPGDSSSSTANADFVAAWQHLANLVHAEGAADGITVQTVWNPADVSWSKTPTASLYPGNQYVDIISSDVYSPTYPAGLTDWATGGTTLMSSATAWAAVAANREHFWQYTDGTIYQPTGDGDGWSMADLIAFAKAQGKPISISETGAGGNGGALGPVDDPAFPQWLAGALAQAEAEGVKVTNVDIWATNESDGNWGFLNGQKPQEAAAWAQYFGSGSGSGKSSPPPAAAQSTITLSAPGTVQEASVGAGVTITETITTTNLTGKVYEEVLTSTGAVESGYVAVTLKKGVATSSVHLDKTSDIIQVVNSTTSPTVTADSAPVTITDPGKTGSGAPTVTVAKPTTLVAGQDTFTGTLTGSTPTSVKFGWHNTTTETASAGDMVTATKLSSGSYSATLTVDHPGETGYFYVAVDGNITLEWSAVPVKAGSSTVSSTTISSGTQPPSGPSFIAPSTTDTVTVNEPAKLAAAMQTITGTESDPSQQVFLDWRTSGTPALGDGDWVQASVSASGQFSASVDIDHAGVKSTMYYRIGSGAAVAAWSATPS